MTASKTNERPGTRAVLRHSGLSASKVRQVLDLIRGQDVDRAAEILIGTEREAANIIGKVLASAVANAARLPPIPHRWYRFGQPAGSAA